MALAKIDTEGRLYVLTHGTGKDAGFTTLGFDNADRRLRAVLAWLPGAQAVAIAVPGTPEHYAQYEMVMAAGAEHHKRTGKRCDAELTPQLVGLEGKRVTVTTPDGETTRFYVGKSTGWMPCHLEVKSARSSGGPAVYVPANSKIRVA